ncbi:Por secretion system C-terminal sorting domain-containing protein [Aquimarina amphilecti]|uniref:Por secretion system C-terminal sorting domain-containing protein n=1 Tax=Aquimarina amphilecti TaxID=1038014 RepID=A0A1H7TF33_AQUAM|nr:ThuA domain-containing protein [Aquimarina amphilecti]SEL83129.1 Por secretion system C-terminal sorting domain-containing protein [Aquimarina amphilecti]
MKKQTFLILLFFTSIFNLSSQDKVLVFTKTNGFTHPSIGAGVTMITNLGAANGLWSTDQTDDANDFTTSNLAQYSAVIWCNTSGNNLLNATQRQAFEDFIAAGGGFLGIHAATDTYRDQSWTFYNELVGGIVQTGPNHTSNNFNANMTVVNSHPSVDFLGNIGATWNKSEEYYYWRNNGGQLFGGNIDLLKVESTGSNDYDEARPISWYKEYGGGRSFYTALGHNANDYTNNTNFIKHVEEGIKYVIGNTLSVGGPERQISFLISPNPANEVIRFSTSDVVKAKSLMIYDINGQLVYQGSIPSNVASTDINIEKLSNGLYIGNVVSGKQQTNFKFIKRN